MPNHWFLKSAARRHGADTVRRSLAIGIQTNFREMRTECYSHCCADKAGFGWRLIE